MALLVAMHLVLTRVFVVELGAYRISVGSVCTILAGVWLGPVAGGVCGLAADLIGCFMKGYAVNPFRAGQANIRKMHESRKDRWSGGIHHRNCSFQLPCIYHSRPCDLPGI